ncbi:hypothetical protein T05_4578 [Trichinella murrelli]|uniref:Uncharacterized protein n=1 Tax=Trichinella murrelli TaxID=144512 RepID=A0A0V0UCA4_9BILA|nr:hypothetical protein T05_4578 [Trichinella murrelli]
MISRIQFENFNKLFITEISISSIFKTIKCTTGTHKRVISQECLHHFEKNKSNCMQLAISIDAQPVITSAVKLGEVPMKFEELKGAITLHAKDVHSFCRFELYFVAPALLGTLQVSLGNFVTPKSWALETSLVL